MSECLLMQNPELAKSMSHTFPDLTGNLFCSGIPLHSDTRGGGHIVRHVSAMFLNRRTAIYANMKMYLNIISVLLHKSRDVTQPPYLQVQKTHSYSVVGWSQLTADS